MPEACVMNRSERPALRAKTITTIAVLDHCATSPVGAGPVPARSAGLDPDCQTALVTLQ
jgi:hypothetical protein